MTSRFVKFNTANLMLTRMGVFMPRRVQIERTTDAPRVDGPDQRNRAQRRADAKKGRR